MITDICILLLGFWSPVPLRCIYHIPTLLKTENYEPIFISCDDDYSIPSISLFDCLTCEEFLNNHELIFEKLEKIEMLKTFNEHRLKRFLESDQVIFHDHSKKILEQMLHSNQSMFHIKTYGGITHEHLQRYDDSLFTIIREKNLHSKSKEDFEYDGLTFLIANMLFQFVDKLPIPEIYLQFHVLSNSGNLNIVIRHKLLPDMMDNRFKLDPLIPIKINCFLAQD